MYLNSSYHNKYYRVEGHAYMYGDGDHPTLYIDKKVENGVYRITDLGNLAMRISCYYDVDKFLIACKDAIEGLKKKFGVGYEGGQFVKYCDEHWIPEAEKLLKFLIAVEKLTNKKRWNV